jgi:hypothetical protein
LQIAIAFFASIPLGFGVAYLLVSSILAPCRTYDLSPYSEICDYGTPIVYGAWFIVLGLLLWLLPFRKAR